MTRQTPTVLVGLEDLAMMMGVTRAVVTAAAPGTTPDREESERATRDVDRAMANETGALGETTVRGGGVALTTPLAGTVIMMTTPQRTADGGVTTPGVDGGTTRHGTVATAVLPVTLAGIGGPGEMGVPGTPTTRGTGQPATADHVEAEVAPVGEAVS